MTFADSLFLDSLNRGTAPMVKHNAQKQKCFKKRDFFNYFFANRWNIQFKVKEKTWEYLSDWLRFGWKCKELENNGDFVVLWPCLQMSQCRRKVCVNDKKTLYFHFSSERIKFQTFALSMHWKSLETTLESRIDSFLSNLRSSTRENSVKVGGQGKG